MTLPPFIFLSIQGPNLINPDLKEEMLSADNQKNIQKDRRPQRD